MDMRLNSMVLGILTWTLGIVVPAIYSVHMTRIALSRDTSHFYTASQLMSNFNSMPILMWVYTLAMGFLGLCLILYGFSRPRLEEELSV
jgi:hypothetical protein